MGQPGEPESPRRRGRYVDDAGHWPLTLRAKTCHGPVCTENSDSHVVVMQSAEEWL